MSGLRFSVGDAMFWVGILAVDCGLARLLFTFEYLDSLRALSLLPMANALPLLARRLARRPASRRPFAAGFLAGGASALAALVALGWARGEAIDPVTLAAADASSFPLGQLGLALQDGARSLGVGPTPAWALREGIAALMFALALAGLTLPQWAPALLVGALAWAGSRARRRPAAPEVGAS